MVPRLQGRGPWRTQTLSLGKAGAVRSSTERRGDRERQRSAQHSSQESWHPFYLCNKPPFLWEGPGVSAPCQGCLDQELLSEMLSWGSPEGSGERPEVGWGLPLPCISVYSAPRTLSTGPTAQGPLSAHLDVCSPHAVPHHTEGQQGGAKPLPCPCSWGAGSLFTEHARASGQFSRGSVGSGARWTGWEARLSPYLRVALGRSPHLPALSFPTWRWA